MSDDVLQITTERGVTFDVWLNPGQAGPVVVFTEQSAVGPRTAASYYARSLLEGPHDRDTEFSLHLAVPEYGIDPTSMRAVRAWIRRNT